MDFEWDAEKSDACFEQRGFDFTYVAHAFFDPDRTVQIDARHDYGEERYRLCGRIEGRLYVVVYTVRGAAIRIISARKANQRENQQHDHRTHSH